jgi:hypothetical protein
LDNSLPFRNHLSFAEGFALTEICRTASDEPLSAKTSPPRVDTIQDLLYELGMKPHMHVVEIIIFSQYHTIY